MHNLWKNHLVKRYLESAARISHTGKYISLNHLILLIKGLNNLSRFMINRNNKNNSKNLLNMGMPRFMINRNNKNNSKNLLNMGMPRFMINRNNKNNSKNLVNMGLAAITWKGKNANIFTLLLTFSNKKIANYLFSTILFENTRHK
jgi:hypothetical protein